MFAAPHGNPSLRATIENPAPRPESAWRSPFRLSRCSPSFLRGTDIRSKGATHGSPLGPQGCPLGAAGVRPCSRLLGSCGRTGWRNAQLKRRRGGGSGQVVSTLARICVDKFREQVDVAAIWLSSRHSARHTGLFIEGGGWATMSVTAHPTRRCDMCAMLVRTHDWHAHGQRTGGR